MSFRKAGDSTVDKGCMSSIMYSESKLLIFVTEMGFLFNTAGKVHCLFGSLSLSWSSVSLLCFLFSGCSTSLATIAAFLCTVLKCFLKLEVVFLAYERVLFPLYKVQRTFKFLSFSLSRTK